MPQAFDYIFGDIVKKPKKKKQTAKEYAKKKGDEYCQAFALGEYA